jgi:hypothetical protein
MRLRFSKRRAAELVSRTYPRSVAEGVSDTLAPAFSGISETNKFQFTSFLKLESH